jgi:hypothetical protein
MAPAGGTCISRAFFGVGGEGTAPAWGGAAELASLCGIERTHHPIGNQTEGQPDGELESLDLDSCLVVDPDEGQV